MSDHDTADRALLRRIEAKQAEWRGEPGFVHPEWVWELAAALARRIAEGERLREAFEGARSLAILAQDRLEAVRAALVAEEPQR